MAKRNSKQLDGNESMSGESTTSPGITAAETATPVPAAPIERLVDTTGAGDLFAAGFLFGVARGHEHVTSARLGALAAAEIIQHIGARPERSLKELAQENGLPV